MAISDLRGRMPAETSVEGGTGALLLGSGVIWAAANISRGRRGAAAWLLPTILTVSGLAFILTSTADRRAERIEAAEGAVRDDLEGLDPFARAQVLKDVAQEQVEQLLPDRD